MFLSYSSIVTKQISSNRNAFVSNEEAKYNFYSNEFNGYYVPLNTTGVISAWYRSDYGVLYDNYSNVTGWMDFSNNGNNLIASGSACPKYVADNGSGFSIVKFNGVSNVLRDTNFSSISNGNEFTIFAVVNFPSNPFNVGIVSLVNTSNQDDSAAGITVASAGNQPSNWNNVLLASLKDSGNASNFKTTNTSFGQYAIIGAQFYNGNVTYYENNTSGLNLIVSKINNLASGTLRIGARYFLGTESWYSNMNLSEVLIYTSELSSGDFSKIFQYLDVKYNIY